MKPLPRHLPLSVAQLKLRNQAEAGMIGDFVTIYSRSERDGAVYRNEGILIGFTAVEAYEHNQAVMMDLIRYLPAGSEDRGSSYLRMDKLVDIV